MCFVNYLLACDLVILNNIRYYYNYCYRSGRWTKRRWRLRNKEITGLLELCIGSEEGNGVTRWMRKNLAPVVYACRFAGYWFPVCSPRCVRTWRTMRPDPRRRTDVPTFSEQFINRRRRLPPTKVSEWAACLFVCAGANGLRVSECPCPYTYASQAYSMCVRARVFLHSKNFHRAKSFFPCFPF